MEDQESASNRGEASETRHEDSKLEHFDVKLGQFSDRFEKIENTISALPAQLGCQDKRPEKKGAELELLGCRAKNCSQALFP